MPKYNKKFLNLLASSIVVLFLLIPIFAQVFAQDQNPPPDDTGNNPSPTTVTPLINNPFRQDTIQGLISVIIDEILIPVGGVIAVLMIIYAGFLFVTARGSEKQIGDAKKALIWAVVGAGVLLGARIISQAIQATITQISR